MPTYQYACTACQERLEAVQSFTDAPLAECPACGGALRKVFSAVGVVFKGSGFYKTDSRSTPKSGSSSGDGADGKPAAKSDGSSDSTSTGKSDSAGGSTSGSTPPAPAKAATPASKSA